jgi:transcriptional regulator with XRE-family HTH domain
MGHFKTSKIIFEEEAIAEMLKSAREEKKLSLKNVGVKLSINYRYLEALEQGKFNKLPKGVYGKNFLKEYSNFLGLNTEEVLKIFDKIQPVNSTFKDSGFFSKQVIKRRDLLIIPKITKGILIVLLAVACLVYLGYSIKEIVIAPALEIIAPEENLITRDITVEVKGKTQPEAELKINNTLVMIDKSGNFSQAVNLKTGMNNIVIEAKKKYGRAKIIERQILVETD